MLFKDFGFSDNVDKAITECGYERPTPIQEKAIPQILMMRDVIGQAQTGTGKTASFTLPMIEILSDGVAKARMPRSLILVPTRELASQVADNFDTYGKYVKLNKALIMGGVNLSDQRKVIEQGPDVLIATPGRLIDFFERGDLILNDIKMLVIDEADRMLDMGFIPDVRKIIGFLPKIRQTLLFSATMPPEVEKLANEFMQNPKKVVIEPPKVEDQNIAQNVVILNKRDKKKALKEILDAQYVQSAYIFCNRKRDVGTLGSWLKKEGYEAAPMHGDMTQTSRMETLERFRTHDIRFLVCSDVAARGIDIEEVSHVLNYDVPMSVDDYTHRIGRTGRAGKKGEAYTFVTSEDQPHVDKLVDKFGDNLSIICLKTVKCLDWEGVLEKEKCPKSASKSSPARDSDSRERPSKSNVREKSDERNSGFHKKSSGNLSVIGFGDDVPAFMR